MGLVSQGIQVLPLPALRLGRGLGRLKVVLALPRPLGIRPVRLVIYCRLDRYDHSKNYPLLGARRVGVAWAFTFVWLVYK